jgi:hypothetical protein
MQGKEYFNFKEFDKARDFLSADWGEVISPADIDRHNGFDALGMSPDSDWHDVDTLDSFDLLESFDRDIEAIRRSDAIYMLKGWQSSTGATAEHACAKWLRLEIIYQEEGICEEAHRIQGGDRQQDYGDPTPNHEDIANLWNVYIKVASRNREDKQLAARDVAHMMILMKVARNCHKPKRDNWVDMAGYAQCGGKIDKV